MWFVCDGDLLFFPSSSLCVFLSRLMWRILSARLHSVIASASAHTHTHRISLLPPILLRCSITQQLGHFLSFSIRRKEGRRLICSLDRAGASLCCCEGKAFSQSSTISLFGNITENLYTIQLNFLLAPNSIDLNTHLLLFQQMLLYQISCL